MMETDDELDALLEADDVPPLLAQQRDESAVQYAAFLRYLRLGRKRSIRAVAADDGHDERWLERVSSKHRWAERAAAFDRLVLRAQLRDVLREACGQSKAA
jgi:hypothetical protein